MGSAAVAAAMYEVARFRLAHVLTKEAALSVELAVSMIVEVVEGGRSGSEDTECIYKWREGSKAGQRQRMLRNFLLLFSKPLLEFPKTGQ